MRTTLRTVATAVVVAVGLLLVGPQQLGGPVAAVSTFGESMLPTYRAHDLVVVRRDTSYKRGQVVAYHSDTLDTVVLHRIVGGDSDGWVTQGDNNDWLDPDRPTAQDVIGRAWFAIPEAGRVLEQPRPVRALLPLIAVAGIMVATRPGKRDRDGRRRRRASRPRHTVARGDGPVVWAGLVARVGAGAAVLLALGGALSLAAWTRSAFEPGTVNYTSRGDFSYHAAVPTGPVYADGRIDSGEPVFLRLATRLDVTFDYRFDSDPAPRDLQGSGQLVAVVADGSGWQASVPAGPLVAWTGPDTTLTGTLDLAALGRLASRVAETTGVSSSSRTVTLIAEVTVDGQLAGVPFTSSTDPTLTFRVDDLQARPAAAPTGTKGADDPLVTSETGSVTVPELEPARLDIAGRGLPVSTARPASIVLIALGAALAAAAAVLASRTRTWDEHQRIAGRYGDAIIDVAAISPARDRSLVAVASIDQLVGLAFQRELPVLRVPMVEGGHGYVVDDTNVRYRYIVRTPEDHPPSPADIPGRPARQGATPRDPAPHDEDRLFPAHTRTS